jgi:circadian clock protein KaiB
MIHRQRHVLRLFVAGDSPNSTLAIANVKAICDTYLPGSHDIEIIDVFREPKLALAGRILMTPALVKLSPPPVRSIAGTLTDTEAVLNTLGLNPTTV